MTNTKKADPLRCGIVMPISDIDGYPTGHWAEVKEIIRAAVESIRQYSFRVALVSESDVTGVIQKRIMQRLYSDDIVICDVSAKNANVMFEVGIRLAFDKPTVLIKDDATPYIFDTGPLEHIEYPKSLRHTAIQHFAAVLADKVQATYERTQSDANSTSYLKSFGDFEVAKIGTEVVDGQDLLLRRMEEMQSQIAGLQRMVADTTSTMAQLTQPLKVSTGVTAPAGPAISGTGLLGLVDMQGGLKIGEAISRFGKGPGLDSLK